jgi:hypothetical protein
MTTEHWEEILGYFDLACDSDGERVGDQSILDEGWADLPISSSPSVGTDYWKISFDFHITDL